MGSRIKGLRTKTEAAHIEGCEPELSLRMRATCNSDLHYVQYLSENLYKFLCEQTAKNWKNWNMKTTVVDGDSKEFLNSEFSITKLLKRFNQKNDIFNRSLWDDCR